MIFSVPRFASRAGRRAGPILAAALALVAAGASLCARAADEPQGGIFTTPGYPQRGAAPGAAAVPGGIGSGSGSGNAGSTVTNGTRPSGSVNGLSGNPRDASQNGRRGDGSDSYLPRPYIEPPKPSEFQRFVEGATGRLLPIFGARFFADAGDTYQSLDNVPVSADYTLGPGDEIVTRAWGSIDVDFRSTVDRNGMLNLPRIGSFNVAGVKASELERNLRAQIGRLYTNFELSVSLGQLRGLRVFVVGPAQRPGVQTLSSQSTLLSAVVAAGGPAPSGSMRKVLLRRDGRVISELDVYEFLVQGDKSKDVQLAAGDVVVFQPAGARVALTGSIDTPAIYELKTPQEPIQSLLRYAGGAPVLANPNRVQLERIDALQPSAPRSVEAFRLDAAGLQKQLRDGDVLTLLAISPQFANAVTLKGSVAQPLRYPFTAGMRIRDLIPDREALISPDFYRRKNLLVQVIEGDDTGGRYPTGRFDPRYDGRNDPRFDDRGDYRNDYRNDPRYDSRSDPRYDAGADGRRDPRDPRDGYGSAAGAAAGAGLDPSVAGGNGNGNAGPARNDGSGRGSAERDARNDDRSFVQRARRRPAPLFDELNWDYATIERLNPDLTTQVIPFNLGKAVLQGDEANNVALAPGDVVTVYSQKDVRVSVGRQTRLVSLEGEIAAPGIYQLQAGDTLKSLVARAGGFTPQAYVYGLEFSREETRLRQRENLAAAITRLQALSAVQTARDAANRRDDTSLQTTAAVSNAATQAQLARLSRVEPNGRIALELTPEQATVDALPDLPLDAGDRILVPPRPGFVTVAGAVVNSNAFIWKPGRTAGDYLRLAGADEAADTSNMFILRADGTVNHAGDRRGFFGRGSLDAQVLQPGDALIVPNQLDFETWGRAFVRNLKDISQIFAQFGLGIAAINAINN